jgi:hypothetical protein
MNWPFCGVLLERKDVKLQKEFLCPCCHKQLRAQAHPRSGMFRFLILGVTLVGSYLVYVFDVHSLKRTVGLVVALGGLAELIFNYLFAPPQIKPAERGELLRR